jgi:uncharacterized protein (DUF362 family)
MEILKSKVCLLRCEKYDYAMIQAKIDEAFALLGGIEKYIKPGMRVLLKPNLVIKERPESHATTHPFIIRAIAFSVIKAGASAIIADSPGGL